MYKSKISSQYFLNIFPHTSIYFKNTIVIIL